MSLKRDLQYLKRKTFNIIKRQTLDDLYFLKLKEELKIPVPQCFDSALFNFTIDFELIWGNGNVDGTEHSKERRIKSANSQQENFLPFLEMLEQLNFPITWATLGKLANHKIRPETDLEFAPNWAQRSWYDDSYKKLDQKLWDGEDYLKKIRYSKTTHEFMSHGHAHIDYCDMKTTKEVARWDMEIGISTLRELGLNINGFVFPCNHHQYYELLKDNQIQIIRGSDANWLIKPELIITPIGFWISPAFYSLSEMKKLIDLAVSHKAFFHPWMHLIECDLKQKDIENFYSPLFEYIKELEDKKKIQNVSFTQINHKVRESSK